MEAIQASEQAKLLEEGDDVLLTQDIDPDEQVDFADPTAAEDTDEVVSSDTKPAPAAKAEKAKPAPVETDDDLPENLRGKSPKEIAKMYVEAQRVLGRQGQELGELRNLADTHIRSAMAERVAKPAAPKEPVKPIEDKDFFADPVKAVEKAIENHPEVQRLRAENQLQKAAAVKQSMVSNQAKFDQAHPDAGDILNDPEFQAWVGKSQVRKALLARAHHKFDFVAGDEVFTNWKELKASKAPAQEAQAQAATAKAKASKDAARVPTSRNPAPKASANSGEKIYRRADLIKLQMSDPDRYDMMGAEIEAAYREGRVR